MTKPPTIRALLEKVPAPRRPSPLFFGINIALLVVLFLFDEQVLAALQLVLRPLHSLVLDFSRTFGEYQVLIVAGIVMYLVRWPKWRLILLPLIAVALAGLVMVITKPLAGRVRPNHAEAATIFYPPFVANERLPHKEHRAPDGGEPMEIRLDSVSIPGTGQYLHWLSSPSIPSGHATGAMANATALGWILPQGRPLFYFLATAGGLSRVERGRHFPADVMAGFLVGHYVTTLSLRFMIFRIRSRRTDEEESAEASTPPAAIAEAPPPP